MNENQIKMGYLRDEVDNLKLERNELESKYKELKSKVDYLKVIISK